MRRPDLTHRTWICSVVFTDIVGFSKITSIQGQLALKKVFNGYLTEALKPSSPEELIILDTGDGAAICFNDPEEAFVSSLAMRNSFAADRSIPNLSLQVRIGINLGPVKLIDDMNGKGNAVGDGINDAQRVMSFAEANQVLASRSFYEVVRSLGEDYANLFAYQGVFRDKHEREHTVYRLLTRGEPARLVEAPKPMEKAPVGWPPELLQKIEIKLAGTVGPIARLLIRKAAEKHSDWNAFAGSLAEHMATEQEKKEFLAYCQSLRP